MEVAKSNKSDLAGMSNAENAIADARRILDAHLLDRFFPSDNGDVLAASNNDFITEFLDIIGGREEYIDKNGARKPNLAPRVKAAVLAAMLNPEKRDIIENLLDNPQGWSGLINGLFGSVANLAKLDGNVDYNLADELSKAVEIFVGLQRAGESVATFNAQGDMFNEPISDEVGFLIELFEKNTRTPTGISGVLNEYYNLVKNIDTTTQDMFGEENPSKIDELRAAYQKYSTSLTEEPNVSWRDTGEPTEAEIAEARRQKDEVKAKWTNPDGSMKKGYHCAPNGKPSKLTEEQWLLVRTPNFKKWFGDWEKEAWAKAAMDFLEKTAPVANLTGHEFQKDGVRLTDKVSAYFNSLGNIAHNEELGDVILNLEGIRDSIAHGIGRLKASAFMAVKDVIENGFIFNRETNWKNRNYDSAVIVAPISINNTDYICEAVITRRPNENRFYLHEVEIKETLEKAFKTPTEGRASQASKLIIGKHLAEVKGKVSQVVDENGEPLVVYHGTTNTNRDYTRFTVFKHSDPRIKKHQHFFSADRDVAGSMGDIVYDVFLKCENPLVIDAGGNEWGAVKDHTGGKVKFADLTSAQKKKLCKAFLCTAEELESSYSPEDEIDLVQARVIKRDERSTNEWADYARANGYDGVIFRNLRDGAGIDIMQNPSDVFVAFDSNQIKSATDNIGSFSTNNPDIRWRFEDSQINKAIEEADSKVNTELANEKQNAADKLKAEKQRYIRENFDKWDEDQDEGLYNYIGGKPFGSFFESIREEDGKFIIEDENSNAVNWEDSLSKAKESVLGDYFENEEYDELDYLTDSDSPNKIKMRKFIAAINNLGIEVDFQQSARSTSSEYIWIKAPNGDKMKIRFADHDNTHHADISVQKDWKAAVRYVANVLDEWFEDYNNGDTIKWRTMDSKVKQEADKWVSNPENVKKLAEEYLAEQKGQIVVDPDKIRAKIPNYEVSLNSDFVEAGDKILEEVWKEALSRAPKDKPVVLLTGNPAAGKGTAIKNGLLEEVSDADLVFDAPQNKFTSVEKRVKEAVDAGYRVRIVQIYNDPITSWRNSLERGIGKDDPETGKRGGGRFLPMEYFVRVYESAQGKVEKIETILKRKYKSKLITKYIDSAGNKPIVVSPDEAKAWDYSIGDSQLKEIERITDEYRGRIEESARLRGDKKDPLAIVGRGVSQVVIGMDPIRGFAERISRRTEPGDEGAEQSLPGESGQGRGPVPRLKALLRQDRTENPVIWASIVLAREILNGRGITRAKVEKLLPTEQFDGSKQNYAVERAQRIAEKTKATQKQFSKDLDIAIRKAESNLYWQDEFVENAYRAFSKGGEEYGFAKQRLMQYLKDLRNKELNKVKGYETDDFDVDLVDAILKAQEAEPERAADNESKTAGEEAEEELEESGGAFEGDDELSGKKTPLAPSKIRDVIGAIRREVVKRVRNSDGDQKTLDEKYRKTLVNVLTDAMKELVYGKEREDIGKKIEELKNVKHAVITVKDGERVGQKIDNFTLRAENIALRIFRRGVRDSKKLMTEKLDAILARRGKKPSRMQRDDKRSMTGLVQQRIYNISRYVEMDAEALEDVRREAVEKLENIDENFVQDAEKGKIREDVEDVRAEVANVLHDIEMFGGWADKSRAEMAQALEFLEKTIDTETAAQRERVEQRKERNAKVRKIISDALKMSEHNAARDGRLRVAIRKVLNGSLPLDSFLGLLGESATGETRKLFEEWRKDFVARVDRAANAKANEVFQTQQKFIKLVEDSYSMDFHDALKRLLEKKGEYEKFSKMVDGMRQPMSLANVIQLYVSAAQKNYERNFYEHRAVRSPEYKKLQDEIDEIRAKFPDRADKTGAEWEDAKARIDELEKKQAQMRGEALADYLKSIEVLLSDGDRRFIEGLRQLYKDALPSISAVAKRVIGLPIEQADALYMPVKVKRSGNLGEGVPQVPVVPKSLSQRVPHLRDLDETADPISLFTDRISENAQFKHFSELYIEMRGIFGDGDLQDLIRQRCGADVLTGLKEFIADIATGKTRGPQNELLRKTNGLTAVMLLGFNLGSGVRQVLPGVASFAPAIGGWNVFKNMMSFFTPEGFAAAREICRSDTGRRRFEIGNMQIMEELLSTPDQNRFWAAYKRHALFFNRFADKLSIMFIGQGIYRSGVGEYLRKGFSEAEAKKLAMADMWQIAERTQASGRIHNMSHWQRRGGEYGKALGLFSSPPQLMFSMAYAKCRRALALGVKTPEGRAAVWDALSTLFYVSVCVEGSYALSGVLWNALLKGFFDDDDGEQILKQMALGPFGGLFIFGRIIEGAGSNYGTSLAPIEQLSRPIRNTKNLLFDAGQFDAEKALEDLDKLAKSLFPLYRDGRKLYENLTD